MYLCIDIIQSILNYSDFMTQLRLTTLCKEYYEKLKIYSIDKEYGHKLTQIILNNPIYNRLQILNCDYNPNITDINHLGESLIELHCRSNSGINDFGIKDLKKLQILDCEYNKNITDVNHLTELIKLHCYGYSGLNDFGIKELKKLQILDYDKNSNITNANNLKKSLIK